MDDLSTPNAVDLDVQLTSTNSPSQSPLPDAEYQEYIKQFPFAAESTYFTRPNRYYGPASTWRSWTANDRRVVDVLDEAHSQDLSAHLYHVFALKQRSRRIPGQILRRSVSRSGSKSYVGTRSPTTEKAEENFVPPDSWTAWPLHGNRVPRRAIQEGSRYQREQLGRIKPSAALEEALVAVTLRHARNRWASRETASPEPSIKHEKKNPHITNSDLKEQAKDKVIAHGDDNDDDNDDDNESESENSSAILSSSDDGNNDVPGGVQTFSSQAFVTEDSPSSASSDDKQDSDGEENIPVFTADDDRTRLLLKPIIRHTLTKLDDLLTGLHKARQAYAIRRPSSRSRSRSVARTIEGTDVDDTDGISQVDDHTTNRSRGRKRKRSPSSRPSSTNWGRSQSQSHGDIRSSSEHVGSVSRSKPLNPRDWSDVLGMAALTGWNADTIARASRRCALLFGQNMMFRTFHESNTSTSIAGDENGNKTYVEESFAVGERSQFHGIQGTVAVPPPTDHNLLSRKVTKATHQHPMNYVPVRSEPFTPSSRTLSCPVQTCSQHEYVYTRATRLYDHMRIMHPDIDLDRFKRAMGRGGRRGRYDRSGLRSRSRTQRGMSMERQRSEDMNDTEAGSDSEDEQNDEALAIGRRDAQYDRGAYEEIDAKAEDGADLEYGSSGYSESS